MIVSSSTNNHRTCPSMMLMIMMTTMMFLAGSQCRVWAFRSTTITTRPFLSSVRLFASVDEFGRRIRQRPGNNNNNFENNDDDDSWDIASFDDAPPRRGNSYPAESGTSDNDDDDDGWDDFDPFSSSGSRKPRRNNNNNNNNHNNNNRHSQNRGPPRRKNDYYGSGGGRGNNNNNNRGRNNNTNNNHKKKDTEERKTNMKALEGAGFVHLYGLACTLNALKANKRDFARPEDRIDVTLLEGDELQHELQQRDRKPEAQFSPWLFLQEQKGQATTRATSKAMQAEQVKEYATERGLPIAYVDKGVLNTLAGNRPHQGYVLRCGKLDFTPLTKLPSLGERTEDTPQLWLALDEVVDPQNLGALLRSAFFLGQGQSVGILVCAKNSAPPSPVVSASSAGALEVMDVYSTNNLPRTLASAELDGYRVIGASSSVPRDSEDVDLYNLQDLPALQNEEPTVLVLGSEGHGLRPLVAKACTEFVRIPGGGEDSGVDSLNVSVTGGILLWHLLRGGGSP